MGLFAPLMPEKVKYMSISQIPGIFMSKPTDQTTHAAQGSPDVAHAPDVVESIAHVAPIILPIVGGVLMFLLAFIAVYMA